MSAPRTIALFGGSFDPPHYGHVLAAAWARWRAGADAVWVLPVWRHPWGKPLSPWERRWRLLALAFAAMPFVALRDDELRSSGYTIDLVQRLARTHPGVRWLWVGGGDTVRDLPRWQRGDELARLVTVVAVPRAGCDLHPQALPAVSSRELRARLRRGESVAGWLPEPVLAAIRAEGWYGADDAEAPP